MTDDTRTLDPRSTRSHLGDSAPRTPILRILYHGQFDRIGATTLDGTLAPGIPLPIGRKAPLFAGTDGVHAPLGDPCISRHQLTVTWNADDDTLSVSAPPNAQRPIYVGADRRPADPRQRLPPGTLIEIADRVLLWFDLVSPNDEPGDALGMIGQSDAMRRLRARIRTLAASASTVLVHGETGVGKELVVRALHAAGPRRRGPFVAQNCGALPAQLAESELFGHVRGAFTGADRARAGVFEQATGGTLFLDEIGELPAAIQATLLRVVQERTLRRVGSNVDVALDVCLAAATHRDLEADARNGRFRADLFARLERPAIRVPPLRERLEDVPLLLAAFLAEEHRRRPHRTPLARLWAPADEWREPVPCAYVRALMTYDWPRNVRELRKLAVEIAIGVDGGGRFDATDAPRPITSPLPPAPLATVDDDPTDEMPAPAFAIPALDASGDDSPRWDPASGPPDAATFEAAMRLHAYRPAATARWFDVARNTVYTWMKKHGLPDSTDYGSREISHALVKTAGDIDSAALHLRISARALKLRMTTLDIDHRQNMFAEEKNAGPAG